MPKAGEKGSVVTLLCDGGDRYIDTYFNPDWESALDDFDRTGVFEPDLQVAQLRKL